MTHKKPKKQNPKFLWLSNLATIAFKKEHIFFTLLYIVMAVTLVYGVTDMILTSLQPKIELSRQDIEYEIVGIHPPKHFQVDLRNVETGVVKKHVNISKHCNEWKKLPMYSRWIITEVAYQQGSRYYTETYGLRAICDDLSKF